MAGADDDIEKLLREVDSALRGGVSGKKVQPAGSGAAVTAAGATGGPGRRAGLAGSIPRATAIAGAWGVGVGGMFLVLPFLQSVSGALGAFVAAFSVSILGRRPRR